MTRDTTFLTVCQGKGRRRPKASGRRLDVRRPYVSVGAEPVLGLGSADGGLAAHRPTSGAPPTERLDGAAASGPDRRPRSPA